VEEVDPSDAVLRLRTNPCSVEAGCLYKKGKWIEREVIRETVSEQAKPTILRDIGEFDPCSTG